VVEEEPIEADVDEGMNADEPGPEDEPDEEEEPA
jgi:hypothetical protein